MKTEKRAFIIGNGPSLNDIDMKKLRNEVTFGSNRIYLGFEKWGFETTYWGIVDELQIKQCYNDYNENLSASIVKYIPEQFQELFHGENYHPIPMIYNPQPYPQFANDWSGIYDGWTVTFTLIQLAYLLGYKELYLIGVDHNYVINEEQKRGHKWSDKNSINHFDPTYNADDKGVVWNLPNSEKSTQAYEYAATFLANHGVSVKNATPNTKLEAFEKVDFNTLF